MKKSTKIGLYILSGGVVTALQVAKRYCKIKAKEGKSKVFNALDGAFDFVDNWIENVMGLALLIGMFVK